MYEWKRFVCRQSLLNTPQHVPVTVSFVSSQVHWRKAMGKTKYAVVPDTTSQTSETRNPYSVLRAETMPAIPKAFCLRLGMPGDD